MLGELGELRAGARRFYPLGTFAAIDVEADVHEDHHSLAGRLAVSTRLIEAELFLRDGELGAYQLIRIGSFDALLEQANTELSESVLESAAEEDLAASLGGADTRTVQLWVAKAESGGAWLELEEGVLVIRLPASNRDLLKLAELVVNDGLLSEDGGHAALTFLRTLGAVELGEEELRLFLGRQRPGYRAMLLEDPAREGSYSTLLLDAVRERGWVGPDSPTPEHVEALLWEAPDEAGATGSSER